MCIYISLILFSAVSAPRFISGFPSHLEKWVDEPLELQCTVSGTPCPVLTWRVKDKNNTTQILPSVGNKLVVKSLTEGDSGKYTCIASNQHGEASISVTVHVKGIDLF